MGQPVQPRHRPEQRRLAASARSENADELPAPDGDRDALERLYRAGLRLVDLRRALDADLRAVRGAQNQPSSSGFAYCMNSMTAPPTSTNATVRKPSPTSNGSASTSWP